jgi:hypothetical protein
LAAIAFATSAITSTGAAVAGRGGIMEGTWNWPPYAGSGGGMPGKTTCGYVWVDPHRHKPGWAAGPPIEGSWPVSASLLGTIHDESCPTLYRFGHPCAAKASHYRL